MFIRLIHSDLHLGHVFLKYPGKNLERILKMDLQDLRKETPKIKVVDVTGYSIGPQLFDLVDSIKHPVAINADEFPTSTSQRRAHSSRRPRCRPRRPRRLRTHQRLPGE